MAHCYPTCIAEEKGWLAKGFHFNGTRWVRSKAARGAVTTVPAGEGFQPLCAPCPEKAAVTMNNKQEKQRQVLKRNEGSAGGKGAQASLCKGGYKRETWVLSWDQKEWSKRTGTSSLDRGFERSVFIYTFVAIAKWDLLGNGCRPWAFFIQAMLLGRILLLLSWFPSSWKVFHLFFFPVQFFWHSSLWGKKSAGTTAEKHNRDSPLAEV